jgi:hypothetical protein
MKQDQAADAVLEPLLPLARSLLLRSCYCLNTTAKAHAEVPKLRLPQRRSLSAGVEVEAEV